MSVAVVITVMSNQPHFRFMLNMEENKAFFGNLTCFYLDIYLKANSENLNSCYVWANGHLWEWERGIKVNSAQCWHRVAGAL